MPKEDIITMPKSKFIKEHKNLLKVLSSGDEKALAKEFQDQLKEYKSYVGGRAGVSKASGFIMRMMADNKARHTGQYRKPSTPFDWKKLATPGQGGENRLGDYGASPFILKHFQGDYVPFSARPYGPETRDQRIARYRFTARRLEKLARELAGQAPLPEALPNLTRPPPPPPPAPPAPPAPPRQPQPDYLERLRRVEQETQERNRQRREAPRRTINLTETIPSGFDESRIPPPPVSADAYSRMIGSLDEILARERGERKEEEPTSNIAQTTRPQPERKEGEDILRTELPEEWDMEFMLDTDDYDNREEFIAEYLTKHPRATLEQIQKFLKEQLAKELRDEPEYPKFGTALSSIHEPVKKVRKDMLDAYNHAKRMASRFDTILSQPGVSDKLKKLQEFLRRKGTEKGRRKALHKAWKQEAVANKFRDLLLKAVVKPIEEEYVKDTKTLFEFFKRYAPAYHKRQYDNFDRRKDMFEDYYGKEELNRGWRMFANMRLDEKYSPILKAIAQKFPTLNVDAYELDEALPKVKGVEEYGETYANLVKGWREATQEQVDEAGHMIASDEDEAGYVNPIMEETPERKAKYERLKQEQEEEIADERAFAEKIKNMTPEQQRIERKIRFYNFVVDERPEWWDKMSVVRSYHTSYKSDFEDYFKKSDLAKQVEDFWTDWDEKLKLPQDKVKIERFFGAEHQGNLTEPSKLAEQNIGDLLGEVEEFQKLLNRRGVVDRTPQYRYNTWDLERVWTEYDAEEEKRFDPYKYPAIDWANQPPERKKATTTTTTASAPIPKKPPPPPTESAGPTREERLIELMKQQPNRSLFDTSKILTDEGYGGVSASNLSIIINKQLIPKGVWKIDQWRKDWLEKWKAEKEKEKSGKGKVRLEITAEDLIGD